MSNVEQKGDRSSSGGFEATLYDTVAMRARGPFGLLKRQQMPRQGCHRSRRGLRLFLFLLFSSPRPSFLPEDKERGGGGWHVHHDQQVTSDKTTTIIISTPLNPSGIRFPPFNTTPHLSGHNTALPAPQRLKRFPPFEISWHVATWGMKLTMIGNPLKKLRTQCFLLPSLHHRP